LRPNGTLPFEIGQALSHGARNLGRTVDAFSKRLWFYRLRSKTKSLKFSSVKGTT